MLANTKSVCVKCNQPIEVGQPISWNRRGDAGRKYHVDCSNPSVIFNSLKTPEAPNSVSIQTPAIDPKTIKASSAWYKTLSAVLPFTNRVLLIGPPSSGKSTTAILTAGISHRITMTETTSREDLTGMFHLVDGETKWVDGPITSAMRTGRPVLVDEIDRYSPEAASLLYSLIDDAPHVALPNGELVGAQEGYKMIMTSNEGLDTLPPAVQDRIEVILMATDPHEDAMTSFSAAQTQVVKLYYEGLKKTLPKMFPTVRRMRAFVRLCEAQFEAPVAAKLVFGEEGSREVLSAITSAESQIQRKF